jgi:excisionase family DNA binding protein
MPALFKARVLTERDVIVATETQRQMGGMRIGRKVPMEEEVSPQEAAEILKVSRPYAAKLFDEGAIPSRRVGTHRRALTADVLAYKQREKEARLAVLDELAAEGQRLKMGY